MKTICIDARLYGVTHTGIGRYVENLIRYLPRNPEFSVVLIVHPGNLSNPELSGFTKFTARFHPYSLLSQLEMLWLWLRIRPNLLHVTHSSIPVFWPGKLVITFHDLIKHYSRGSSTTTHKNPLLYWIKYLGFITIDRIGASRAGQIIVPSEYWKKELMKKYNLPQDKITVTYEGVDARIRTAPGSPPINILKPYVVYTGNVYPHKNLEVLAKAIGILKGKMNLALVGSRSVFTSRLEKIIATEEIEKYSHILGSLSDSQLASVYSSAVAFVFPSLIEGFGLTGLEAMAVGLPVIAADASCLPEIYGDSALFFNPRDARDLAEKITLLNSDKSLRQKLIKRGLARVKLYSWDKMARETWEIYQNALR